jgi:2-dehydropantoate 2-reductase
VPIGERVILVVGAGAIGGTTAGTLLRAGREVVLVDGWYENVEAIRRNGLAVTVDGSRDVVPARAIYPDELSGRAEIVLLACKSYDTAATVRAIEPFLAEDGAIVSLQNGINEDLIASLVGRSRTIGCVVHYSAGMTEPGHAVRYSPSAWRSYTIGGLDGGPVGRVAALLGAVVTDDIFGALWAKLAVNCMINALTAITDLRTAELWAVGRPLMVSLAAEAAAVARAQGREMQPIHLVASGADLSPDLLMSDPARVEVLMEREAIARGSAGAAGVTSMLQDLRKGRRPEIDYINGYVVREGARLGVATPVNEAVTARLRAVAAGVEPRGPAQLDRLAST